MKTKVKEVKLTPKKDTDRSIVYIRGVDAKTKKKFGDLATQLNLTNGELFTQLVLTAKVS